VAKRVKRPMPRKIELAECGGMHLGGKLQANNFQIPRLAALLVATEANRLNVKGPRVEAVIVGVGLVAAVNTEIGCGVRQQAVANRLMDEIGGVADDAKLCAPALPVLLGPSEFLRLHLGGSPQEQIGPRDLSRNPELAFNVDCSLASHLTSAGFIGAVGDLRDTKTLCSVLSGDPSLLPKGPKGGLFSFTHDTYGIAS
jgi:hypothetical protein